MTVIELPRVSDFLSQNIPQAGISRSESRFSPERYDRAVRTVCFMLVKRLRDDEYDKILKTERDPEKLWQGLMELLDRNGFWQRAKSISNL